MKNNHTPIVFQKPKMKLTKEIVDFLGGFNKVYYSDGRVAMSCDVAFTLAKEEDDVATMSDSLTVFERTIPSCLQRQDIEMHEWRYVGGKMVANSMDRFTKGKYDLTYQYGHGNMLIERDDKPLDKRIVYAGTIMDLQEFKMISRLLNL